MNATGPTPTETYGHCGVCGREMPGDMDLVYEEGWYPCFWITEDVQGDGPVCPMCVELNCLRDDHNPEPTLKPGVVPFRKTMPKTWQDMLLDELKALRAEIAELKVKFNELEQRNDREDTYRQEQNELF